MEHYFLFLGERKFTRQFSFKNPKTTTTTKKRKNQQHFNRRQKLNIVLEVNHKTRISNYGSTSMVFNCKSTDSTALVCKKTNAASKDWFADHYYSVELKKVENHW